MGPRLEAALCLGIDEGAQMLDLRVAAKAVVIAHQFLPDTD